MRYLLLALTLLASMTASALKIGLYKLKFYRIPTIENQITELLNIAKSDIRQLGVKGSNYYFVTVSGTDKDSLDFNVRWYNTRFYMDKTARYNGYSVIGNDTILISFENIDYRIVGWVMFNRKKTHIPFDDSPAYKTSENPRIIKIIWRKKDDGEKKYVYNIETPDINDRTYNDPYNIVTP